MGPEQTDNGQDPCHARSRPGLNPQHPICPTEHCQVGPCILCPGKGLHVPLASPALVPGVPRSALLRMAALASLYACPSSLPRASPAFLGSWRAPLDLAAWSWVSVVGPPVSLSPPPAHHVAAPWHCGLQSFPHLMGNSLQGEESRGSSTGAAQGLPQALYSGFTPGGLVGSGIEPGSAACKQARYLLYSGSSPHEGVFNRRQWCGSVAKHRPCVCDRLD